MHLSGFFLVRSGLCILARAQCDHMPFSSSHLEAQFPLLMLILMCSNVTIFPHATKKQSLRNNMQISSFRSTLDAFCHNQSLLCWLQKVIFHTYSLHIDQHSIVRKSSSVCYYLCQQYGLDPFCFSAA